MKSYFLKLSLNILYRYIDDNKLTVEEFLDALSVTRFSESQKDSLVSLMSPPITIGGRLTEKDFNHFKRLEDLNVFKNFRDGGSSERHHHGADLSSTQDSPQE